MITITLRFMKVVTPLRMKLRYPNIERFYINIVRHITGKERLDLNDLADS